MISVVVAVDVEFEAALVSRLGSLPEVEIASRPADEFDLLAGAEAGAGSVIILSRHFPGTDAEVVRRLRVLGAHILGYGEDAELFRRWGINHCVSAWASEDELATALRDCAADLTAPPKPAAPPAASAPGAKAPVIAVWGTGSAPGRSTIAAGLAHTLSATLECVLVDADTVGAAQASMLGVLDESPHLAALCRAAASGPLSETTIAGHMARLSPRLGLVTGLSRAERWPEIRPGVLSDVITALAGRAQCVVVDVSDRVDPDDEYADPHYDRHGATRAVLDAADHVVIVAGAEPLGLQRLISLLATDRAVALRTRSTIVLNRVRAAAVGPDPEERIAATLQRFAGLEDVLMLPDARSEVDAAGLAGRCVTEYAPGSRLSRALRELAARLPVDQPPTRRRGGATGRHRGRIRV